MNNKIYDLLLYALNNKKSVQITYKDVKGRVSDDKVECPHILGMKDGKMQVLCYHLRGVSSSGPDLVRPLRNYRSFIIESIQCLPVIVDEWKSIPGYLEYWSPKFDTIEEAVPDTVGSEEDSDDLSATT